MYQIGQCVLSGIILVEPILFKNQTVVMQKSMVQELNSLAYSTIFSNRQSFISTHISDGDYSELRRSRIANLPSHKKEDLSGRLNFVVVFQTIQIERLSQEIETLRVKARDWQRQKNNYENYEVQIRELTERCHMLQVQREGILEENERINIFCQRLCHQFQEYKAKFGEGETGLREKYQLQRARSEQLIGEVEKWRNRYTSLQLSKSKQLQQMRSQFEAQRKSTISRQLKELTIKYENEINLIVNDLRKSREEIQFRARDMSHMQEIIEKFEIRQTEIRDIQEKMYQYENKFVMLSQENYRLNQVLRLKSQELQKLKNNEKQFKVKLETASKSQEEIKSFKFQIQIKDRQLQQLRTLISRNQQQNQQLRISTSKTNEYERLLNQYDGQIQKLNHLIHQKLSENDQLRNSTRIMETRINSMSMATQKQFSNYEERIISFTKQQERLSAQLKSRLAENQNLKQRCSDLEKGMNRTQTLQKENNELRGQLSIYSRKIDQFKGKIKLLQQNLLIMDDIEKKLKKEQQIKRQLVEQRQKFNIHIKNLTIQLQTSAHKSATLQGQLNKYSNIKLELGEYHSKIAAITQQLDRINAQIYLRVGQLTQLKETLKSLNNSKINYQTIEQRLVQNLSQMQQLILNLDQSRRQNDRLQNDNMNFSLSIKKLQGEIIANTQQKEQMSAILRQKMSEVQKLNVQIQSMASKITETRDLQIKNQQYQKKIETIQNNYQQMENRFKNQNKRVQQFSMEVQNLSSQIIQLRSEPKISAKLTEDIVLIRKECSQKETIINNLKKRIDIIENILRVIKQKYQMQFQQAEDLRRKVESANTKLDVFDSMISLFEKYSFEVMRVSQQNIMLESQKRMAQLQMCQSMKILQDNSNVNPLTLTLVQQSMQQRSYSLGNNSSLFSFKDPSTSKQITVETKLFDQIKQIQQKSQTNDFREAPESQDSSSMASSIINTLITKQSSGRFQNIGGAQFESMNNPSFGRNVTISKMRYVSSNSPASGSNSPQNYGSNINYMTIDTQLQNEPIIANRLESPMIPSNMSVSPVQRVTMLQGQGIKRVTSYTHFQPYFSSNNTTTAQYFEGQRRDVAPNIRILEACQSPNIVNSTKNTTSQIGKTIRIPVDPSRLNSKNISSP